MAPERGLATYGRPQERVTPAQIYSRERALEALNLAEEALRLAELVLGALGYSP